MPMSEIDIENKIKELKRFLNTSTSDDFGLIKDKIRDLENFERKLKKFKRKKGNGRDD